MRHPAQHGVPVTVTHAELTALGVDLEREINAAIWNEFPGWSRFATDQCLYRLMERMAPEWTWHRVEIREGVPVIALLQYMGCVD